MLAYLFKLKHFKRIILMYLLALAANIVADYSQIETLRIVTKVLLMPLLTWLCFSNLPFSPARRNYGLFAALFFSWLGDIFLLGTSPLFFMLGLGSFLTAHIFYIFLFSKQIAKAIPVKDKIVQLLPFLIFVGLFLAYLNKFLMATEDSQKMLIPVTVYAFVIACMGYTSQLRKFKVDVVSYRLTLCGSLLFILSDSCIAINKFVLHDQMPFSTAIIMSTYCLAQLLIISGLLKSYHELDLFPKAYALDFS